MAIGKGGPVGIVASSQGCPWLGARVARQGLVAISHGCPWLGARTAWRGLVAGSQGCPWLWAGDLSPALRGAHGCGQGIRHQLSRVRMAGGEGSPVGTRRQLPGLLLTPAGRQEAVAVLPLFLPSARFCIFILNRLFCGLTEFGF